MRFLVAETIYYLVEADDSSSAIAARKNGKGHAKPDSNSYRASSWGNNEPIPRDQWPTWAKVLAKFAKPEDKGIGDVVARMIGEENSEEFKAWYLVTFGKACSCTGRQKLWNIKYPLNLKAS